MIFLQQVNVNYCNQIEALCQQQRQLHRELIYYLYKNEGIQELQKVSNSRRSQLQHHTTNMKK